MSFDAQFDTAEQGAPFDRRVTVRGISEIYWPRAHVVAPGAVGPAGMLNQASHELRALRDDVSVVELKGFRYELRFDMEVRPGFDPSAQRLVDAWAGFSTIVDLAADAVRRHVSLFAMVAEGSRGTEPGVYGHTLRSRITSATPTQHEHSSSAAYLVATSPQIGRVFLHELGHMMGLGEGYEARRGRARTLEEARGTPMAAPLHRWGRRFNEDQKRAIVFFALDALRDARARGTANRRWGRRHDGYRAREMENIGALSRHA